MLEKSVEDFLREQVEARGGVCIKLNPRWYKGIPDRLVVLPGGRVLFVELKRPKGGVVAALQLWWFERLSKLGASVHIAATKEAVADLINGEAGRSQ